MLQLHEPHAGIRIVEVTGDVPMTLARGLVLEAMIAAQDAGVRRLGIDVSTATGLGSPHTGTRLDVVREWAAAARPGLALAFVGPESIMDAQRVGLAVARGFGLLIDVFTSREDAIDWLLAQRVAAAD
jgi:pseudouridine-5'-phosphate glycosidase